MSLWSNRFVNLTACLLLAACQSTPPKDAAAAAAAREVSPDAANGPGAGTPTENAGARPIPQRAAVQYADALKMMKAGRTADAEVQFKQMSETYPEFSGPEVNLGLIYLQGSRLLEAESAFKAALSRNPASVAAGNELGIVERKLGKFSEAEAAYQRTIAADPNYAPAYLNLGVLYDLYLAEPKKALEEFEHYIELAGDNKQVAGWVMELRKRAGAPAPAVKKEPA